MLNNLSISITFYLNAHPWFKGLLVCLEAAALGAAADAVSSGFDFTGNWPKHASVVIGTSCLVAVRNYMRTAPADQLAH